MGVTILAALFVFGMLVLVHELGHFVTAKLTGMRVDEFAIGFGPKLVSRQKGETVYSIRAIPLGGFNDIAGMNPEENEAGDRGYCEKSIPARMLVILAGSIMNLILPIFLFAGIFFFTGASTPSTEPVLGTVMEDRPAAEAGLMAGDRILRINDREIASWKDLTEATQKEGEAGTSLRVVYERNNEQLETDVTPVYDSKSKRILIGVMSHVDKTYPGFFESIGMAFERTAYVLGAMMGELMKIFSQPTEAELAGPIGVAQMAGEMAQLGIVPLLNFAAFLSLNLGIINLLPVPALDGGHFVLLILEAVRGKPMGEKALYYTQSVGIALLLILMLFATKNDIVRIFTGG